jgi:hypothetical protein
MHDLHELSQAWEDEATTLRDRYGLESLARLCETHARELRSRLRDIATATATTAEAAEISGYSEAHIRRLLSEGDISDLGAKRGRRVIVAELPRKVGKLTEGEVADLLTGRNVPRPVRDGGAAKVAGRWIE